MMVFPLSATSPMVRVAEIISRRPAGLHGSLKQIRSSSASRATSAVVAGRIWQRTAMLALPLGRGFRRSAVVRLEIEWRCDDSRATGHIDQPKQGRRLGPLPPGTNCGEEIFGTITHGAIERG